MHFSNGLLVSMVAIFIMLFFYNVYTFWLISHISRKYQAEKKLLNLPDSFFDVSPRKAFNLFKFLALPRSIVVDANLRILIMVWRLMFLVSVFGFIGVVTTVFLTIMSQQI